jgi:ribosomal protein S18 acetylase RimI-like enzyme
MDYVIRPLTAQDESIVWDAVYLGIQPGEHEPALPKESVQRPELAHYVEGWGRTGDVGFVAHDPAENQLLGAVWMRGQKSQDSEETPVPELAFAVKRGHRRRGIGAALLTQFVKANPHQSVVKLSVAAGNPAVRLYERFGFKVVDETPDSVTMRRQA